MDYEAMERAALVADEVATEHERTAELCGGEAAAIARSRALGARDVAHRLRSDVRSARGGE